MIGGVLSMLMLSMVALALFPARSVANPVADWLLPSWDRTTSGVQDAKPERLSKQSKCTFTSALFQPGALVFGGGVLEASMVGGVLSMLMPLKVVETTLPARSVQVPVAVWFLPSWPSVTDSDREATPETMSAQ